MEKKQSISFDKYLLSTYYMADTVTGAQDVKKIAGKVPALTKFIGW